MPVGKRGKKSSEDIFWNKKYRQKFVVIKKVSTFALGIAIGLWCNGNTTDSGPVFLGSNPGSPTLFYDYSFLGYGVMVTQQILVLFFLVRIQVAQLEEVSWRGLLL